jgi:hypothetical protein
MPLSVMLFWKERGTPPAVGLLRQVCGAGGLGSGAEGCGSDGGNACIRQ